MKLHLKTIALAGCVSVRIFAQAPDTMTAHRAAAVALAGTDYKGILSAACPAQTPPPPRTPPSGAGGRGRGGANAAAAPTPRADPPRDLWYAEPVKVFDNLYFVGTKEHGSWAVTTSDGIIVIDALYGYAVKDEVDGGLRKLGLDPAKIKYLVVTHGHGDHSGGAKYLQDTFSPHVILGPKDWDMLAHTPATSPRRDIEATDGQKLTLGDTTITLYITPGHTASTISVLVPVKDGGKPHVAMEWGGTAITPATSVDMLKAYIASAARIQDEAIGAGADVIITNHTVFDGALDKLEAVKNRKPGDPNPYVVGKDTVSRYLAIAEECGKANLAAAEGRR